MQDILLLKYTIRGIFSYPWVNFPVLRRKLICWRVVAWMVIGVYLIRYHDQHFVRVPNRDQATRHVSK